MVCRCAVTVALLVLVVVSEWYYIMTIRHSPSHGHTLAPDELELHVECDNLNLTTASVVLYVLVYL